MPKEGIIKKNGEIFGVKVNNEHANRRAPKYKGTDGTDRTGEVA